MKDALWGIRHTLGAKESGVMGLSEQGQEGTQRPKETERALLLEAVFLCSWENAPTTSPWLIGILWIGLCCFTASPHPLCDLIIVLLLQRGNQISSAQGHCRCTWHSKDQHAPLFMRVYNMVGHIYCDLSYLIFLPLLLKPFFLPASFHVFLAFWDPLSLHTYGSRAI